MTRVTEQLFRISAPSFGGAFAVAWNGIAAGALESGRGW